MTWRRCLQPRAQQLLVRQLSIVGLKQIINKLAALLPLQLALLQQLGCCLVQASLLEYAAAQAPQKPCVASLRHVYLLLQESPSLLSGVWLVVEVSSVSVVSSMRRLVVCSRCSWRM